ncbi:MAG: hypothetical protein Q8Q33_04865, partial [Chlamydiota bacterium]|nr:hypothetical protein [Chlamydiota bacterium]
MLDIKFIREHKEEVEAAVHNKNMVVDIVRLLELDEQRRNAIRTIDDAKAHQNRISDEIAQMQGGERDNKIEEMRGLKDDIKQQEEQYALIESEYIQLLKQVPNIPASDVPIGQSEAQNVVVKEVGEIRAFKFEPKNHWQIAEKAGMIDKKRAANVAGSRFAYIKGDLVRLQLAIVQFVIDTLGNEMVLARIIADNGLTVSAKAFTPVLPPLMIRTEPYDAMDRLEPRDD